MAQNTDFLSVFPDVLSCADHVRSQLRDYPGDSTAGHRWTLSLFSGYINQVTALIPGFERLLVPPDTEVAAHICHFLVFMTANSHWGEMDEYDRNVLLWVSLLHDIGKKVGPNGKRDLLHPFESTAICISLMQTWGWLSSDASSKSHAAQIMQLIRSAVTTRDDTTVIQDNAQLPWIMKEILVLTGVSSVDVTFTTLREAVRGKDRTEMFALEILLLTLLHQSVSVMRYKPSAPLHVSEYYTYFTPRLARLLTVVMMCDSGSYSYVLAPSQHVALQDEIQVSCENFLKIVGRD